MPDISEFPQYSLEEWKKWFIETAALIIEKTPDEGVTIFYQSDIKLNGEWIDKSYLCQRAAEQVGSSLLWHKIVCRSKPGIATFGRPAFSHLLCFSKKFRLHDLSISTADVLPELGEKTWERGIGLSTALMATSFIANTVKSTQIINPFCGEGAVLAAANANNLIAIGIERSPKRAEKSKSLEITADCKNFVQTKPSRL